MDSVEELYERIEKLEEENADLRASITCIAIDMNKVCEVLSLLMFNDDTVKQILEYKDTRYGDILKQWATAHDVKIPHKIMIINETNEVRLMSKSEYDEWLERKDSNA